MALFCMLSLCLFHLISGSWLFGAVGISFSPAQLYHDGYGLPSHLKVECVEQIKTSDQFNRKKMTFDEEDSESRGRFKKNNWFSSVVTQDSVFNGYTVNNYTENKNYVFNESKKESSSPSSGSSDEKKRKNKQNKTDKNNKALLITAAIAGVFGVGVYVWDFFKHKNHPKKGSDYIFTSEGFSNLAYYETHYESRFNATTLVALPGCLFNEKGISKTVDRFHSEGIFIETTRIPQVFEDWG